jgi:hypothetical protein
LADTAKPRPKRVRRIAIMRESVPTINNYRSLFQKWVRLTAGAAQPYGERTPLAGGFRRLAENLVPPTF